MDLPHHASDRHSSEQDRDHLAVLGKAVHLRDSVSQRVRLLQYRLNVADRRAVRLNLSAPNSVTIHVPDHHHIVTASMAPVAMWIAEARERAFTALCWCCARTFLSKVSRATQVCAQVGTAAAAANNMRSACHAAAGSEAGAKATMSSAWPRQATANPHLHVLTMLSSASAATSTRSVASNGWPAWVAQGPGSSRQSSHMFQVLDTATGSIQALVPETPECAWPAPRTSASMVTWQDRFLVVFGGLVRFGSAHCNACTRSFQSQRRRQANPAAATRLHFVDAADVLAQTEENAPLRGSLQVLSERDASGSSDGSSMSGWHATNGVWVFDTVSRLWASAWPDSSRADAGCVTAADSAEAALSARWCHLQQGASEDALAGVACPRCACPRCVLRSSRSARSTTHPSALLQQRH